MYYFWNYYIKRNYGEKANLCYIDTDSFNIHVKTNDISKNIAEDFETTFETSNYEIDRSLPIGKNKKVIELMKDDLGGQIMKRFVKLGTKTYRPDNKTLWQRCNNVSLYVQDTS